MPIESFGHIAAFDKKDTPVVTMFGGGLDSPYLLLRLQQLGFTNIHAVAVDFGVTIDIDRLTEYAARFGGKFTCIDGREHFVKEDVVPAIRAHAMLTGNVSDQQFTHSSVHRSFDHGQRQRLESGFAASYRKSLTE